MSLAFETRALSERCNREDTRVPKSKIWELLGHSGTSNVEKCSKVSGSVRFCPMPISVNPSSNRLLNLIKPRGPLRDQTIPALFQRDVILSRQCMPATFDGWRL